MHDRVFSPRPPFAAPLTVAILLGLSPAVGGAADGPTAYSLPHTEVRTLTSEATGVDYVLYVSLPRSYASTRVQYPTVYLLDADYSFAIAHNVVEHFVDRNNLPPMILVGIAYPGQSQDQVTYRQNRTRDYTPTHTLEDGYSPTIQRLSGGGGAFRDVIGDEIVPFMERTYRVDPVDRTLVGHSFGGLFATYVLLTRPGLFRRYIVVSPSYWYDERAIFGIEAQAAKRFDDLPARIVLGVGDRENGPLTHHAMVDDLLAMANLLRGRGYPSLHLETHVFRDETHNSVFPVALTRGLRRLFHSE